ncbi:hypothetical protein NPX13_g10831 [Xylaria arbuscula]|uniref:Uncharacterized protein n=1 Tax=Xylaria arbuscula TaxID=114810 RepID=A0A9W8N4A5_9PEZI|nr:hypothetical protein NPX13_g10831 [Xylaria arbuscula]
MEPMFTAHSTSTEQAWGMDGLSCAVPTSHQRRRGERGVSTFALDSAPPPRGYQRFDPSAGFSRKPVSSHLSRCGEIQAWKIKPHERSASTSNQRHKEVSVGAMNALRGG